MRKLLYITIGYAASIALCVYTKNFMTGIVCLAAVLLFSAVAGTDAKPIRRIILAFLGCMTGFWWFSEYNRLYLNDAVHMDQTMQTVLIRAADCGYRTDYGMAFDGTIELAGKFYQVKTYLDEPAEITPGDQILGKFRFRVTTPDGADESTYHQGKGIFLLAYQEDEVSIFQGNLEYRDIPAHLRREIREMIQTCFPPDTYPFALALLIGDTSQLDYATDTDFKISGIRHVIAVSGLHVSILFALISTVTFRNRWLTALVGYPILFLFAAVAGFSPSVSRACIMSGLMLLAVLARKEYDGPTALSFAVVVILTVNPLLVTSVSLQLSVASVAGIFLFSPGIRKWLTVFFGETKGKRIKSVLIHWFTSSVSITLSAMILTTPLCAWYFGTVSLISVVTNLLTLWVVSFVFYGIMAVCILGVYSSTAACLLGKLISIPIRYVLLVAKVMADVPMAAVYTRSVYITEWLIFVYMLLIIFLFCENRKPGNLCCCAVLGLCFALQASWIEPMLDDVRFTVLDVGQGQCLLFQTEGKTYMIDCGGDSDKETADIAAETLLSQGISRLDGLILTHLDSDHAGAAENFLSRIDTKLLILPPQHTELGNATSGEVVYATEDLILTTDKTHIRIYGATFPGNSNEMSLCILFDSEKCDILVTGDRNGFGERALLRSADIPDVDILVAGHHGSKNSTCEELLTAVRPETVCISAGADNSYGHPAPETLQRLSKYGCTVYRTDKHGTIIIRR